MWLRPWRGKFYSRGSVSTSGTTPATHKLDTSACSKSRAPFTAEFLPESRFCIRMERVCRSQWRGESATIVRRPWPSRHGRYFRTPLVQNSCCCHIRPGINADLNRQTRKRPGGSDTGIISSRTWGDILAERGAETPDIDPATWPRQRDEQDPILDRSGRGPSP